MFTAITIIVLSFFLWRWLRSSKKNAVEHKAPSAALEHNEGEKNAGANAVAVDEGDLEDEPSEELLSEYKRRLAELALPAVKLIPDPDAAVQPFSSRLGGPIWVPSGMSLPVGRRGEPLEFVAQINFAEIPQLPDYPEQGVLQLFIGHDDLMGAHFEAPNQGNFKLLWHPEELPNAQMLPPPSIPKPSSPSDIDYYTPFEDADIRLEGIALRPEMTTSAVPPMTLPADQLLDELNIDSWSSAISALEKEYWKGADHIFHHVGGHPEFVQTDFRLITFKAGDGDDPAPDYKLYDRVLFRLTSDKYLMWGSVGEAVVMISRSDLIARDFSRAVWWWDCG